MGLDASVLTLASVLDDAVVGNAGAKAACEVAMVDLVARRSGLPVFRMLGGETSSVATDMTIAADAAPGATPALVAEGFRHLKVKVGVDQDDVARVREISEGAGEPVRIRIDANQGWDIGTAISSITAWLDAGVDIEFLEQPLPRWDLAGHARLRAELPVPIMLDESVFSAVDLHRAVDAGAADILNIKLAKCGGLATGLQLARLATGAGLDVMVGSMMESRLGVSAAAALAIAVAPAVVHDLDAAWWSIPPGQESPYDGNRFTLDDAPGLDPRSRLPDPCRGRGSPVGPPGRHRAEAPPVGRASDRGCCYHSSIRSGTSFYDGSLRPPLLGRVVWKCRSPGRRMRGPGDLIAYPAPFHGFSRGIHPRTFAR